MAQQREQSNSYPEHDKLAAVADQSQAIGEFLDLGRWTLCELREWEDARPSFEPVDIQGALAEWFEIDRDALEREKRAMLAELRGAQHG
jgi:hypothetical protein